MTAFDAVILTDSMIVVERAHSETDAAAELLDEHGGRAARDLWAALAPARPWY